MTHNKGGHAITLPRIMPLNMLIIGLTGGIATGKGVVARAWASRPGVAVHDADEVVHELYRPGSPLVDELVQVFGPKILDAQGRVNRKALGAIVFADPNARRRLNALVHPAVRNKYLELANEAQKRGVEVFVIEAALLLDGDPDRSFFNMFVTTELEQTEQVRRLTQRDKLTEAEALRRIRSQSPQSQRRERADVVLDTSGTVEQTKQRAIALLEELRKNQEDIAK